MGVHDEVRARAVVVKGHVGLVDDDAADALLPVPTAELVADLRATGLAKAELDEVAVVLIACQYNLVHVAVDAVLVVDWRRLGGDIRLAGNEHLSVPIHRVVDVLGARLVDQDVARVHPDANVADAVVVKAANLFVPLVILAPGEVSHVRRGFQHVPAPVGVLPKRALLLLQDHASSKAPVHAGLVEHDCVLYVVAAVAHDGYAGVLPTGYIVEVDEVEGARLHHRLHGIDHGVDETVDPLVLVHGDRPHSLLAHGALVGVARRLVVVWEGDEAGDHAEEGEGVDLEVGVSGRQLLLLRGDEAVVLLVDVDVLDDTLFHEILDLSDAGGHGLEVDLGQLWPPRLYDEQGPADAAAVRGDVDCALARVQVDGHELPDHAPPPHEPQLLHELLRPEVGAEHETIQEHKVRLLRVDLPARQLAYVHDPEVVA
mmetsp:Transcript_3641/g.7682  ORF Transcript_3641/g.7682 Transcript_3641/m.7682 type:complete len:429 (-) Transcript_3641:1637-2923(-)